MSLDLSGDLSRVGIEIDHMVVYNVCIDNVF